MTPEQHADQIMRVFDLRGTDLRASITEHIRAYGIARATAECERILAALDGVERGDVCRVIIRALA